jgi:hypothetical protein
VEVTQLLDVRAEIEQCINIVVRHADSLGIDPYKMQDSNGKFMLHDLVIAKANIDVALFNYDNQPRR